MWRCLDCDAEFKNPAEKRYCVDEYNGTQSLFGNWQYAYCNACPECGSDQLEEFYESEDEEEWED